MEPFLVISLILLILLAVSNLIVGISNDAVNFLNSAIGSKAATTNTIIIVASIGILFGVTFSGGMMDIARNGIFIPSRFTLFEIMSIFLAVMLINVILLDFFNTFGLPTSTTTTLIFELLGASIGVVLYIHMENNFDFLKSFINTVKLSEIIYGILVSVFIAFALGIVIQFVTRIIFTFNFNTNFEKYGSVFSGIVLTSILYFILIRGASSFVFMSPKVLIWLNTHKFWIIVSNLILWSLIFEILKSKINILKLIVLVGTFALAMAFAGNDLVNFIGAPFGGFVSFYTYIQQGKNELLSMDFLNTTFKTPYWILLLSGIVMVLTLFFSRKSRTVMLTEINLGKQGEVVEKFKDTRVSSKIVKSLEFIKISILSILPHSFRIFLANRYLKQEIKDNKTAFDLIRASVNLLVATIVIAFGTSLKLPLSTTFITFMVAMGTAFADGAWTKENAVYRVSGVLTVLGGWIITILSAFLLALIAVVLILWGKYIAVLILSVLSITLFVRFYFIHNKIFNKNKIQEKLENRPIFNLINSNLSKYNTNLLIDVTKCYILAINYWLNKDYKNSLLLRENILKTYKENSIAYLTDIKSVAEKGGLFPLIEKEINMVENCHIHITGLVENVVKSTLEFIENKIVATNDQYEELNSLTYDISEFIYYPIHFLRNSKNIESEEFMRKKEHLEYQIDKLKKRTLKRVKNETVSANNSLFMLQILSDTENLVISVYKLLESASVIKN